MTSSAAWSRAAEAAAPLDPAAQASTLFRFVAAFERARGFLLSPVRESRDRQHDADLPWRRAAATFAFLSVALQLSEPGVARTRHAGSGHRAPAPQRPSARG
jgi:hypothetical protein